MGKPEESEQTPTGEIHAGKGYGAEEDISLLGPPPNDLGLGVSPMVAQGGISDPNTQNDPPHISSDAVDPASSSEPPASDSGYVSVGTASAVGGAAALIILALLLRDDPAALGLLVLIALFAFTAGWHLRSQS